jgi:transposase InsO family protein
MQAFLAASALRSGLRPGDERTQQPSRQAKIRELRREHADLRTKRRQLRQTRHDEDVAWRKNREALRRKKPADGEPKVRARWGARKQQTEKRRDFHEQRQQRLETRKQEDEQWRSSRQDLRERMHLLPLVSAWIAVLLITDNCTRQCLGLPIFVAGAHVTAEMVVAALRTLLPDDLQFLISDRGIHFTAQVFQQLAVEAGFVHVVIARHRPQSNGIAERFVRTIKEWLADKAWSNDQELLVLLNLFLPEFNDRTHQGLPLPGLSPNEYAKRIWLM